LIKRPDSFIEFGKEAHMPTLDDIALMAHLMRRAGFGVNRDELEFCVAKGYEAKEVWRIPPALNGHVRRPVPGFTVLTGADHTGLGTSFQNLRPNS
jgi:hypothetical protein